MGRKGVREYIHMFWGKVRDKTRGNEEGKREEALGSGGGGRFFMLTGFSHRTYQTILSRDKNRFFGRREGREKEKEEGGRKEERRSRWKIGKIRRKEGKMYMYTYLCIFTYYLQNCRTTRICTSVEDLLWID